MVLEGNAFVTYSSYFKPQGFAVIPYGLTQRLKMNSLAARLQLELFRKR